jgi:ubiquinone biosynthesis protein
MWERKRRGDDPRGTSWTGLLLAAVLGAAAVLGLQTWGHHHHDGPPPEPEWHRHP